MLVLALASAAGAARAAVPTAVSPAEAIAVAVRARLDAPVLVTVADLDTAVAPEAGLVAEPEATARLSRPARFVLKAGGARRGIAVATVIAEGRHPRAARAMARDEVIGSDAVVFTDGILPMLPIRRLLRADEVSGLQTRRDIVKGEPLTPAVLRVPPLVKSGDEVAVTVRVGAVEVVGTGVASGSGHVGDAIRVRQPHSSRLLTGRITGPGAVEIAP